MPSRVCATLLAWLFLLLPVQAERRVALVMGNGLYKNAVQLPNPPGDAEAMAGMLSSIGFEVVLGTNLGRDAMTEKMGRFAQLAGGGGRCAFLLCGSWVPARRQKPPRPN